MIAIAWAIVILATVLAENARIELFKISYGYQGMESIVMLLAFSFSMLLITTVRSWFKE